MLNLMVVTVIKTVLFYKVISHKFKFFPRKCNHILRRALLNSEHGARFLKTLIVTALHLPSCLSRTLSPPSTNSIPADVTQYVHCSQRPSGAHLHLEANVCTRSNVIWHKSKLSVHREQFGAKCVHWQFDALVLLPKTLGVLWYLSYIISRYSVGFALPMRSKITVWSKDTVDRE